MFFSYFQKVLAAKRKSIRAIAYDFMTFVMFSIIESIILVFPKHSNFMGGFEVIHEKIMQIGKSRTTEELWRLRKTKNEYSRGLRKITNGKNSIPKFWGKLFEDEDLKRRKSENLGPGLDVMRLGHAKMPRAWNLYTMRLGHFTWA